MEKVMESHGILTGQKYTNLGHVLTQVLVVLIKDS